MRIGITYDLKNESGHPGDAPRERARPSDDGRADRPDDFQEEFDSPATIEAIAAELRGLGHDVDMLGDGRELIERLLAHPPDFVFNIAEGQGIGRAREARVPALLEMLDLPYTGSDPLTLAATLDKDCAKRLVQSAGVVVPRGVTFRPNGHPGDVLAFAAKHYPVIVKPAWEGSSKGIRGHSVVDCEEDLLKVVQSLWQDHRQPVLLEEYVEGDELTVGVIGNRPPQILAIMRVLPTEPTHRFVYSLEIKRDFERLVRYDCPAQLPAETTRAVATAALKAYEVLGCRDVSRIDFRLRRGIPYFLEVNPLPGLNPQSGDLVIMSRHCGWSYSRLIEAILQSATERQAKGIYHSSQNSSLGTERIATRSQSPVLEHT
jgi:D-alanine-D-alanine ligase